MSPTFRLRVWDLSRQKEKPGTPHLGLPGLRPPDGLSPSRHPSAALRCFTCTVQSDELQASAPSPGSRKLCAFAFKITDGKTTSIFKGTNSFPTTWHCCVTVGGVRLKSASGCVSISLFTSRSASMFPFTFVATHRHGHAPLCACGCVTSIRSIFCLLTKARDVYSACTHQKDAFMVGPKPHASAPIRFNILRIVTASRPISSREENLQWCLLSYRKKIKLNIFTKRNSRSGHSHLLRFPQHLWSKEGPGLSPRTRRLVKGTERERERHV